MERTPEDSLNEILEAVGRGLDGVETRRIAAGLQEKVSPRVLQKRIKALVDAGILAKEGDKRWTKYRRSEELHRIFPKEILVCWEGGRLFPYSGAAEPVRDHCRRQLHARDPVGYRPEFLKSYRPNVSAYLSGRERAYLKKIGSHGADSRPAGSYARQLLDRLLIDLTWNSSRLEGNSYSLLDTWRLLEFGQQMEGGSREEVQMIWNHKAAIEYLVEEGPKLGFDRRTLFGLHSLLANDLLDDDAAIGQLRKIPLGIWGSVFSPLADIWQVSECFDRLLATAAAIDDPFEQSFFLLVQLPYLQPFQDVNKRVSRFAANIPFIRHNLMPLSFVDVPRTLYTEAILGVYEQNNAALLKDVYLWAYQRSVRNYTALQQSMQPDPVRMKYRSELYALVREAVRDAWDRPTAFQKIAEYAQANVSSDMRERFRVAAERTLLGLHEYNSMRYKLQPEELAAWQAAWKRKEFQAPPADRRN